MNNLKKVFKIHIILIILFLIPTLFCIFKGGYYNLNTFLDFYNIFSFGALAYIFFGSLTNLLLIKILILIVNLTILLFICYFLIQKGFKKIYIITILVFLLGLLIGILYINSAIWA